MKPHRIKHIPTGLYYKPFGNTSNLSKTGKVYLNNTNSLNLRGRDYIPITINCKSSILKNFLEDLPELSLSKNQKEYSGRIPKSKFEIEFLE